MIVTKSFIPICSTFLCPLAVSTSLSTSNHKKQIRKQEGKEAKSEFVQCFLAVLDEFSSRSLDFPMLRYRFELPSSYCIIVFLSENKKGGHKCTRIGVKFPLDGPTEKLIDSLTSIFYLYT